MNDLSSQFVLLIIFYLLVNTRNLLININGLELFSEFNEFVP